MRDEELDLCGQAASRERQSCDLMGSHAAARHRGANSHGEPSWL